MPDVTAVRQRIRALVLEINRSDARTGRRALTISELVDHYRQRELKPDTVWKTHSTKVTYQGYLNKWILPRWGAYALAGISAGEVELWLRSLPLARSSCAKIRNLMSTVFNHGIRYEICSRNPVRLVRQSAKRRKIPTVLSASEVQSSPEQDTNDCEEVCVPAPVRTSRDVLTIIGGWPAHLNSRDFDFPIRPEH